MENIPKNILYGEFIDSKRNLRRPQLHYRDVSKRPIEELNIDLIKWEELAMDRSKWKSSLQSILKVCKKKFTVLENKRRLLKEKIKTANIVVANTVTNGLDPQSFMIQGSLLIIGNKQTTQLY